MTFAFVRYCSGLPCDAFFSRLAIRNYICLIALYSFSISEAAAQWAEIGTGGLGKHQCANVIDGYPYVSCWGDNTYGQLGVPKQFVGDRSALPITTPLPAQNASGQVSTGKFHTCASISTVSGNKVFCWGRNESGQLGYSPSSNDPNPYSDLTHEVRPAYLGGSVRELALGRAHSCAIMQDFSVRCWGANSLGQLGNGTFASDNGAKSWIVMERSTSGLIRPLLASSIAAGSDHTCAIATDNNSVYCWGADTYGQIGNGGYKINEPYAVRVSEAQIESIVAGNAHTCAVAWDGAVVCWGDNSSGQLGIGLVGGLTLSPVPVLRSVGHTLAVHPQSLISAGSDVSCVTENPSEYAPPTIGSYILCWGNNAQGQVGVWAGANTQNESFATYAQWIRSNVSFFSGLCASSYLGGIACWGPNDKGQLGRRNYYPSSDRNGGYVQFQR